MYIEAVKQGIVPCHGSAVTVRLRHSLISCADLAVRSASRSPSATASAAAVISTNLLTSQSRTGSSTVSPSVSATVGGGNTAATFNNDTNTTTTTTTAAAAGGGRRLADAPLGGYSFLLISLQVSGWRFRSELNRLILDLKVTDNSVAGKAASRLRRGTGNAPFFPLENYALEYGFNPDGSATYGLLRLETAAVADDVLRPVYLMRTGRVFRVILPYHQQAVTWSALYQTAKVEDAGTAEAPQAVTISVPEVSDDRFAAITSGSAYYGGETTDIPLPSPAGDVPEPQLIIALSSSGKGVAVLPFFTWLLGLSAVALFW